MERLFLTVLMIILILLAFAGLLWGWRNRLARQADLPGLPDVPLTLGEDLTPSLTGLYVSSTPAGRWQERIVANGLGRRASVTVHLSDEGVLLDRVDEDPIFIPMSSLHSVRTAPGIAGKVMGMPDGVLILTWQLGDELIDSGVRVEDLDQQEKWIEAVNMLIPAFGLSPEAQRLGSERLGSERLGSERLGSERLGSERLGSERLGSERLGSERLGSERLGSERLGSERLGSERLGSERLSRSGDALGRSAGTEETGA